MGLLTCRPYEAMSKALRWSWGCGASVMQNLTDNTSLSYQAPAGQNLRRTEGLSYSEPCRGDTIIIKYIFGFEIDLICIQ